MKLPEVTLGSMRISAIGVDLRQMASRPGIEVRVDMRVLDRGGESVQPLRFSETFAEELWSQLDEKTRAQFIRRVVLDALTHEVDEWLRVDGKLVTNAHPEKPGYAPDALFQDPW
jgi:hypothetical protein